MDNEVAPRTLTPYDLVASDEESLSVKYNSSREDSSFNNWSNWGNGPTDPGYVGNDLEKTLS